MLDDEITQLLRELARVIGASSAAIVHQRPDPLPAHSRMVPLGNGAFLRVVLMQRAASEQAFESEARGGATSSGGRDDEMAVAEAMERGARALRACARRWGQEQLPENQVAYRAEGREAPNERIHERIRVFLRALAQSQNADLVAVTLHHRVVAASVEPSQLSVERMPFIIRRVAVEAERRRTSHAELAGSDFYAVSFWFDACLLAFFSAPYAEDFMRYRARLVTREVAPLLAMLEEPPPAPAGVAPIPE